MDGPAPAGTAAQLGPAHLVSWPQVLPGPRDQPGPVHNATILNHTPDPIGVSDVLERFSVENHQVRTLPHRNGADLIMSPKNASGRPSGSAYRLHGDVAVP